MTKLTNEKKYVEYNNRTFLNGVVDLKWDQKAIEDFKKSHVIPNTAQFDNHIDRINFLIEDGLYDGELFGMYSDEDLAKFFQYAHKLGYKYDSFMAIQKFYESYALKSRDGKTYYETFEDRAVVNALFFANGDTDLVYKYIEYILDALQPATPTFANIGLAYAGEKVSCFITSIGDSLNDITAGLSIGAQLSKIGGGVGFCLDDVRSIGEPVRNTDGAAKGVPGVNKLLDLTFRYADQQGKRKGAAVSYISVMHADISEVLDSKRISGDEDARLVTLSIGVKRPNVFNDRAKRGEDYYAFYPKNIKDELGLNMSSIVWTEEFYQELVDNPRIKKKKLNALRIDEKMAAVSAESGYPFMFFDDNVNENNPLRYLGPVISSNLCTEILQTMIRSTYNDYGEKDDIGLDVSCNLASLLADRLVERGNNIEEDTYLAIKALTRISATTNVKNAPAVKRANEEMRSVGLGLMNFHGFLVKNGIKYTDEEAKEIAYLLGYLLDFYTLKASHRLVEEYGSFTHFDKSTYATGEYFDEKPIGKEVTIKNDKVKEIFKDVPFPTQEEIDKLKEDVMRDGIANAYRLAVAPTGNISFVRDATPSVTPIASKVVRRSNGDSEVIYPMPYLADIKAWWTYQEATNIEVFDIIDVIAEFQKSIDQGISLELPLPQTYTTRDRIKIYHYAEYKGLKTLYYARPLDGEECVSCQV